MKKFLLLPFALFCMASNAQPRPKQKIKKPVTLRAEDSVLWVKKPGTKYTDNVDDRMKGPNGEKIFIGPNGGRYYLKGYKKVYVPYGNKTKKG